MLSRKLPSRPVISTATGGSTTQKKYRNVFTGLLGDSIIQQLIHSFAQSLNGILFDHRIREQIPAETVQSLFKIDIFSIDVDLHVFADPHVAHFRHSEVAHGIADRVALGIKHRFFRLHDYVHFHASHANANLQHNKREPSPLPAQ